MKKILYTTFICLSIFMMTSCNVQERIVFNEDMGGRFESIIDLSPMMAMANMKASSVDEEKPKQKIDSLIVFNEILEIFKDSIAGLPKEERERVAALKDMSLQMKVDEDASEMIMTIAKDFKEFKDLERVSYDMDKVFESAKKTAPNGEEASNSPAGSLMTMDKVIYTFSDNIFRRTDPKVLSEHIDDASVLSEKTREEQEEVEIEEAGDEDNMFTAMFDQMGEQLSESKMILEYVFPRKVISVSPEGAVISEDRKKVHFEVDWKTLTEDKNDILENFEVVLEKK